MNEDNRSDDTSSDSVENSTSAVASDYRILGAIDDDAGVGIRGKNIANNGTPVAVEGTVPNVLGGYGFSTPDNLRVGGTIVGTGGFILITGRGRTGLRIRESGSDSMGNSAGGSLTGGHFSNSATGTVGGTVAGGGQDSGINEVTDNYGTVSGGYSNRAGDAQSGSENAIAATVGGGNLNVAGATDATVGGGGNNSAVDDFATIGGGGFNTATNTYSTVGGGTLNDAHGPRSTIGGGWDNRTGRSGFDRGKHATVAGGRDNVARGFSSTVSGGTSNNANAVKATISGGDRNTAKSGADWAVVAGGRLNEVSNREAFIGGGDLNDAGGDSSAILGGFDNATGGENAVVLGGGENAANGMESIAAGRNATAGDDGAVVFGDSSSTGISSNGTDEIRSQMPIYAPAHNTTSARSKKTDVEGVDPADVLAGVRSLSLSTWEFADVEGDDARHIGPMAGEFNETFGLGDDEHIASVDADGVALAAIQALAGLFDDTREDLDDAREDLVRKDRRIDRQGDRIDRQADRIDRLESTVEARDRQVADLRAENDGLRRENSALRDRVDAIEARLGIGDATTASADD